MQFGVQLMETWQEAVEPRSVANSRAIDGDQQGVDQEDGLLAVEVGVTVIAVSQERQKQPITKRLTVLNGMFQQFKAKLASTQSTSQPLAPNWNAFNKLECVSAGAVKYRLVHDLESCFIIDKIQNLC